MRLPAQLRWIVLAWLGAELVTFLALVKAIGFGGTVLLGLATTVVGIVMLRRIGFGALQGLRRGIDGASAPGGGLADGLLAGIGAVLLIIPGFLANLAGLALSAPSARRAVMRRFGEGGRVPRRTDRPDVIDLAPGEWTPVDRA